MLTSIHSDYFDLDTRGHELNNSLLVLLKTAQTSVHVSADEGLFCSFRTT